MKKISLLLIFCFLFQGCATALFMQIGGAKFEEVKLQSKYCSFNEFMESSKAKYEFRFGSIGAVIDLGLVINYYLRMNPVGLQLFGVFIYAITALLTIENAITPPFRKQKGWEPYSKNECRNDYFVIAYESNDFNELKNLEFFLKAILNYPPDYDISQDQNFTNFRKDFSPNYKIQTYYKSPSFYHYIHYPGGKAKFEEDFGKYLYTNRQK